MVGSFLLLWITMSFFVFVFTSTYALKFFLIWFKNTRHFELLTEMNRSFLLNMRHQVKQSYFLQFLLILFFKWAGKLYIPGLFLILIYLVLFLIFSRFLLTLFSRVLLDLKELQQLWNLSILLFITVSCFLFVNNFLVLVFVLELLGIVYYFFFLTQISSLSDTFLKYRNLLSLYLWNSFLVLCLLAIINFSFVYFSGTLDFSELQYVNNTNFVLWQVVLISILWKSGAPGFHFFKIELYRYISKYLVFIFSAYTLYFNYFILMFVLFSFYPTLVTNNHLMIIYLLFVNTLLLVRANNGGSIYNFFAYSSVNTWASIALFGLINCYDF